MTLLILATTPWSQVEMTAVVIRATAAAEQRQTVSQSASQSVSQSVGESVSQSVSGAIRQG